jgi:hypothetical protein
MGRRVIGRSECITSKEEDIRQRRQMDLDIFDCSSVCRRRSPIANIHTLDESDTTQSRSPVSQPVRIFNQPPRKTEISQMH